MRLVFVISNKSTSVTFNLNIHSLVFSLSLTKKNTDYHYKKLTSVYNEVIMCPRFRLKRRGNYFSVTFGGNFKIGWSLKPNNVKLVQVRVREN